VKEAREKVTQRRRGKEKVKRGRGQGSFARERGLYLNIYAWVTRIPRYATADKAGLPT